MRRGLRRFLPHGRCRVRLMGRYGLTLRGRETAALIGGALRWLGGPLGLRGDRTARLLLRLGRTLLRWGSWLALTLFVAWLCRPLLRGRETARLALPTPVSHRGRKPSIVGLGHVRDLSAEACQP